MKLPEKARWIVLVFVILSSSVLLLFFLSPRSSSESIISDTLIIKKKQPIVERTETINGAHYSQRKQRQQNRVSQVEILDYFSVYERRHESKTNKEMWENAYEYIPHDFANDDDDDFNLENSFTETPKFTSIHYTVLPIAWSDQKIKMNPVRIESTLKKIKEDLSMQSFNTLSFTYTLLPQTKINIRSDGFPTVENTKEIAYEILEQKFGYDISTNNDDDDEKPKSRPPPVLVIYPSSQNGYFTSAGGLGNVNPSIYKGVFAWVSYNGIMRGRGVNIGVHEIGHNIGHYHHQSLKDFYRRKRNFDSINNNDTDNDNDYDYNYGIEIMDGFDLMSDGTGDFHVASKWWFGWVNDSKIIMMQPKEQHNTFSSSSSSSSSLRCPQCLSEGKFILSRFDYDDDFIKQKETQDPEFNTEKEIMGIHIPIVAIGTGHPYHDEILYSYWLQYRGSVEEGSSDGKDPSIGLSVHLVAFKLGNLFGADIDHFSYDVNGNSHTLLDSFIIPGTCYLVEPALLLLKKTVHSLQEERKRIESIIPQVCVETMEKGESITINVSFVDPDSVSTSSLPPPLSPDEEKQIQDPPQSRNYTFHQYSCSSLPSALSSFSSDSSTNQETLSTDIDHLIHVQNTGLDGIVSLKICPSSPISKAYFYDRYPYAPLHLNSPFGYGAYAEAIFTNTECLASSSSSSSSCHGGEEGDMITIESKGYARVIKVTNIGSEDWNMIFLNEIEVYDKITKKNVALLSEGTQCYSYDTEFSGDPNCLNDGIIGQNACTSHSFFNSPDDNQYDFCVLSKPTLISHIKIIPFFDPQQPMMTDFMSTIKIELYADLLGQDSIENYKEVKDNIQNVQFVGLLWEKYTGFSGLVGGGEALTFNDIDTDLAEATYELPCVTSSSNGNEGANNIKSPAARQHKAVLGNTWILIVSDDNDENNNSLTTSSPSSNSIMELGCTQAECSVNQYLIYDESVNDNYCMICPMNTISQIGATSIHDCLPCANGFERYDKRSSSSSSCTLSESIISLEDYVATASSTSGKKSVITSWRLWGLYDRHDGSYQHTSSNIITIDDLEFYTSNDCSSDHNGRMDINMRNPNTKIIQSHSNNVGSSSDRGSEQQEQSFNFRFFSIFPQEVEQDDYDYYDGSYLLPLWEAVVSKKNNNNIEDGNTKEDPRAFWYGVELEQDQQQQLSASQDNIVSCIRLTQNNPDRIIQEVRVQAKIVQFFDDDDDNNEGKWENVWIMKDLKPGLNLINGWM